jgi:hypothetical protein
MAAYHFGRALFVVGEPNSGKSNQLRSMFRDIRLGTDGNIPRKRKLPDFYRLSNERCLYLRLTSPHEAKESLGRKHGRNSPTNFLEKTAKKIQENTPRFGRRWNFAGALQPHARLYMPGCGGDMPCLRPALQSGTDARCLPARTGTIPACRTRAELPASVHSSPRTRIR